MAYRSMDAGHGDVLIEEPLTPRERLVLVQLSTGRSNGEIAEDLRISVNTVKFHLRNVYGKLGAWRRSDAVRVARVRGVLAADTSSIAA